MELDKLIAQLQDIRKNHGNIKTYCFGDMGWNKSVENIIVKVPEGQFYNDSNKLFSFVKGEE